MDDEPHTDDHPNRYGNPLPPPVAIQAFNHVDFLQESVPWVRIRASLSLVRSRRPDRGFDRPEKRSVPRDRTRGGPPPVPTVGRSLLRPGRPFASTFRGAELLAKRCHTAGPDGLGRRPLLF